MPQGTPPTLTPTPLAAARSGTNDQWERWLDLGAQLYEFPLYLIIEKANLVLAG